VSDKKPTRVWIQQEHPHKGWFVYSDAYGLHSHRSTKRGAIKLAWAIMDSWYPAIYNKEVIWGWGEKMNLHTWTDPHWPPFVYVFQHLHGFRHRMF